MIKIITANTSNAAMNAVIDELWKNDYSKGRHVVIVPDSHALSAEKVVFERLDINGSMNIEVVSFMRFAKKLLGNKIGYTLSKQGAVLFFKKVINKVYPELVYYKKAALSDGFAGEMYAVIASVRNNGITVEQFEESLLKLSGNTLGKAKDVFLLYKEYMNMLRDFSDSTTRLDALVSEISISEKVEEAYFYLYGFDSLSEKQIEIITALAKYSKGVSIGLMNTNYGANHELYPYEVIERLCEHLKANKIKTEITEGISEAVKEPFNTLHRNLFALSDAKLQNKNGAVTLFCEANAYEQYNAVAREIIRLVRREGMRFMDIAVIDCGERASTDFKEILLRYGIPHFMDERYPLTNSLVYRFISLILDVARYGYRLDKVRALIKNPLFSMDFDSVDTFENYILSENLGFGDFEKPFENEDFEVFRKRIVELASPFFGEKTVRGFVSEINAIIESEDFEARFNEATDSVDANLIALNNQARERLKHILEEYVKLVGDEKETPTGFKKILSSSCEAEEIALIPHYIDAVYIGTLRESCVIRQKAIFVIGATAENLPVQHGYQAIISPLDMDRLEESGIRLYPTPLDKIREERFAFIDLITKTDKLYVGYPEMAIDATQNKPSEAIRDISRTLSLKVKSLNEDFSIKNARTRIELEDAVGHKNNAFYTLMLGVRDLYENDPMKNLLYETLTEEEKKLLEKDEKESGEVPLLYTFGEDKHTKITQLEQYFSCPYRHFLQFGLKLQERKEGKLRVADVGTFVHEVLERYFRLTLGKLRELSMEELSAYADRAVSEVFDNEKLNYLKNDPSLSYLINRLRKETRQTALDLTANVLAGSFEPTYIELEFGSKEGAVKPVKFMTPFGDVTFHGKIDRVDVTKIGGSDVAVAIDYKTGAPKSEIHKVYYGEKLQLYLYLLVLRDSLNLKPVGSFYLPIKSGYFSKGRNYRFTGQIVLTNDNVKALDREAHMRAVEDPKSNHNSEIIPISFKIKNGEVTSASRKNKLTDDEMASILTYVEHIIPLAIKEIGEGYIEKVPVEGACVNCSYKAICGGVGEDDEREILSVNSPLFVKYEGENNGD